MKVESESCVSIPCRMKAIRNIISAMKNLGFTDACEPFSYKLFTYNSLADPIMSPVTSYWISNFQPSSAGPALDP